MSVRDNGQSASVFYRDLRDSKVLSVLRVPKVVKDFSLNLLVSLSF